MRFRFSVRSGLLTLFLLLLPSLALSEDVRLTFLHTNDTHGHLRPFSYPETFDPLSEIAALKARRDIGGIARRAALIRRIRQESGHATLLVDAGDICDGTPFSTEYHGDADIAVMNAAGYDLACPGNHEFNNTLAQVRKMIADAKYPLLCANTRVKADGKLLYLPWILKEVQGVKIAFFGLLTYDARTYPAAREELQMELPIEAAKKLVPELKKQADLIVAVTHIGAEEDIKLAAELPEIDLIIGGHSHTLLPEPLLIPHPGDRTPYSVRGTVIVQDHQWGGTLGRLDLTLHREPKSAWHISSYRGQLLPVTHALPEDPEVAAVLAKYWDPIKAKYAEVLGEAAADFVAKGTDQAEYNLVADAVREQLGLEFEIENYGGVRSSLVRGPITYADVVTMDPFGNTIVTFRATGKQLKEMLRVNRPAVSGIRYVLGPNGLEEATIGGKPIEDGRVYSGATNSYYARFILKDISDKEDTKRGRLEAVIAYLRAKKTVQPVYDGRRQLR